MFGVIIQFFIFSFILDLCLSLWYLVCNGLKSWARDLVFTDMVSYHAEVPTHDELEVEEEKRCRGRRIREDIYIPVSIPG